MRLRPVPRLVALGLALGLVMALVPCRAQARKIVRIGVLSTVLPRSAPFYVTLEQRLRELGYVEGQNLAIEFRNAEGRLERLPAIAAELARLDVDVIIAIGTEATLKAARRATSTTPIVVVAIDYDPVALGYVTTLARPGGTVTGVFLRQPELTAKRLELLKEAVPGLSRVAIVADFYTADQLKEAEPAARSLGLRLQVLDTRTSPGGLAGALEAAHSSRSAALLILASPILFRERARIVELALRYRLPTMSVAREFAEAGAMISYGASISGMFRRAADYVDKIVRGARPADLPVEQPTKFELVVNLKTARGLGLTIPQTILVRADELIH